MTSPLTNLAGVAAIALLAACAPSRPAPAAPAAQAAPKIGSVAQPKADGPQVQIKDFAFAPGTLTVPVGAVVTWTNRDNEPHTVVANDKAIASKALDTDDQFAFVFDQAGSYAYHCSIHPQMTATVVVK